MGGAGCWCSDGQGKPIPNTTTTNGKPICPKITKTNIRRSPVHDNRQSTRSQNRRICRANDIYHFNNNLMNVFVIEYNRQHPDEKASNNQIVLNWKFDGLDVNHDEKLQKIELKTLRRLVTKVSVC